MNISSNIEGETERKLVIDNFLRVKKKHLLTLPLGPDMKSAGKKMF